MSQKINNKVKYFTNWNVKVFVEPEPSMFDSKVDITIKNLLPNKQYTFYSNTLNGKDLFECLASYISDDKGEISLAKQACVDGFFQGIEPMGLFWAMRSYSPKGMQRRLLKRDITKPIVVNITVFNKTIKTLNDIPQNGDNSVVTFKVTRMFMAPGVKRIEVKEANGLQGTLFLPPGKGPFPGVINMFGGMRGTLEFKPALFASYGFAALALPYHGIEGLPETFLNLEMEYFEKAIAYLLNHRSVNSIPGIGVVGVCKGGQVALAMADCLRGIKCVIAINCAVMSAHNSHTYGSRVWPASAMPDDSVMSETPNKSVITRNCFPLHNIDDPEFTSRLFEFHRRPNISYMYIAALSDDDVPSDHYANIAEKLLKSANHPNYTILRYPGAGHLIEPPYTPHCYESFFGGFDICLCYGGIPLPHCRAQEHSWLQQLRFLSKNLCNDSKL